MSEKPKGELVVDAVLRQQSQKRVNNFLPSLLVQFALLFVPKTATEPMPSDEINAQCR